MTPRWTAAFCFGLACVPAVAWGGDWPQFRGPNGAGVSSETQLPSEWSKDKNVAWKIKLPGYAWSSPIVVGDKVFLTTAVSDKQQKPAAGFGGGGRPGGPRPGSPPGEGKDGPKGEGKDAERPKGPPGGPGGFGGGRGNQKPPDAVYRWEVYCLDRNSGKILWHQVAAEHKPTIPTQMANTYASETPVSDGDRVYAYFGMTGLFCYDLAGKQLWSKELGSYPMRMGFGTGSSPTLYGDSVFVQCDNEEKSFLVAFDKKTGEEIWRDNRDEKSSWGTPFIWKNKDRTELVCSGTKKIRSYDPATGKPLWELGGMSGYAAAMPSANDKMIFIGSGGPGSNSPLFAVKAGASGDVTLKSGETSNASVAWYKTGAGSSIASPLLLGDYLYVVDQRGGRVSCYEAKTGKPAYQERLPGATGFSASPWVQDGKIFCLDQDGTTFVLQAGPEFKVLGKNELGGDRFWASAAVAGGALYLRGVDHVYCIRQ